MSKNVFDDFLNGERSVPEGLIPEPMETPGATGLGEIFAAGMQTGVEGMAADMEYFSALINTVTGDEEGAKQSLRRAEVQEEATAAPLRGVQTFEEFIENPTLSGFATQASKGVGQVMPSAASSIASAGVGGLVVAGTRAVATRGARQAAQRLVKESIEKTAEGVADEAEAALAREAYNLAQKSAFKYGLAGGAFASEYPVLAGSNVQDALESGRELDKQQALRAGLLAGPQAAIGVGGEAIMLKLLTNVATKRAGKNTAFGQLAKVLKDTGRGGALEGGTEAIQEGISVVNRASMDENFSAQDAALRLGEAAFAGFFGGAGIAGAGSSIGSVFTQAGRLVEKSRAQTANATRDSDTTMGFEEEDGLDEVRNDFGDQYDLDYGPEVRDMDIRYDDDGKITYASTGAPKEAATTIGDRPTFRTNILAGLKNALAKNPDDQKYDRSNYRLAGLIKRFEDGTVEQQDEIIRTIFDTDSSTDASSATSEPASFEEDSTATFKNDPDQMFPNTESARASYVEAFGPVNWSDPFYSRMTESFLEKAAALKAEDPSTYIDADRDSKGEVYQYTLFKQESEATTAAFLDPTEIDDVLDTAQGSQYSDGGVFLVTPDETSSPINLVNLAVAGTKILRDRGETNWSTPAANYKAGLIEFLKQLSNTYPDYQIQIGRSLTTYSLADVLSGTAQIDERVGNPTAARINGENITLSDLMEADGTAPLSTKKERFKVSGTRATKKPTSSKKDQRDQGSESRDTTQTAGSFDSVNDVQAANKEDFVNEQEVTEYYNTAEEADARAEVLRSEFGFDVTVTDPVTKAKTGAQTQPVQVNDDGRQTQATPDDGPNDAPSTYLNLEGGTSTQGRSGRPTPNAKPKFVPIQYPAGAVNKLVTQIADAMNKAVKLKNSVVIMGVKQLKTMTDAQIKEMFDDPRVGSLIIEQLKDLSNADSKLGKYIEFGDSHVIIVDNTKGNELQAALTVAHEMGHALFNEELDGSLDRGPTRDRLRKAFMRAQAKKDAPAAYQANNPYAFEEWFADQTAIWAKSFLNEPLTSKGLVDSHFKRIAIRLQKMWKALDRVMRQRFSSNNKSQTFDSYINAFLRVRKTYRRSPGVAARKTSWQKKALVREMEKTVEDTGAKDPVLRLLRGFGKLLDNPKGRMLKKIFLPEDNILRKISPAIADMFYVQSNSGSGLLGFLNAKTNRSNAILNDLEDIVGAKWDTKEVQDALAEAADDRIDTAKLTGKAKEVRQYLEKLYDNYIALTPGNQIAKSKNYFPVSLALAEIYNDQEAFIAVVKKYNPDMTDRAVRDVVFELVRKRAHIVGDGDLVITVDGEEVSLKNLNGDEKGSVSFDATDPLKSVEKARILTKNIPSAELAPFLEKPEVALIRYVRHITIRSEFLRATRDKDGKDLLAEALAGLSEDKKERAIDIIERYLGYTTKPLNPAVQKINSYFQLFNWITLLPLATIGSIPEFGGAIVNTREFNGFGMVLKAIPKTVKNRAQAKQLARSLGVSVSTAMGNLGLTDADAEFLDPKVRKLSDGFFKVIGLDFFTRFTREFGAAMGVEFLITHAANTAKNPRAARYLSELNVTAEQITAWNAQQQEGTPYTFNGPEGQAVKDAVTRFVESSMLRPNAAERPAWGNDPMWTLVWALKSFLYSFGKVIIGGVKREMMVRSQEGATNFDKMGGVAMMGGLMAAAFLPLAMVGLELREIAKAGVAGVLPGVDANARYFRSDRMDYGEYLGELINRAGFYGPLAIFSGAFDQVGWGKSGLGSLFGPTAGLLIDDIGLGYFKEGKTWEILPERIIPGYNLVL